MGDAEARGSGRLGGRLPGPHDLGEKAVPLVGVLGEHLVTAVAAVDPHGGLAHQADGVVDLGQRDGERVGAVDAGGEDLLLAAARPALLADIGAREVHDRVDPGEVRSVEDEVGRVPRDLSSGAGRPAHDVHHVVAARAQESRQRAADHAGSPGDGDALWHGA